MHSSHLYRRAMALAALTLIAAPGWSAAPLGLIEAQRLAVARAQQLQATDAAVLATREMAHAAGQLPDPVLKFGVDNLPVNGADRFNLTRDFMTMRRIGVMQEWPSAEKRRLRADRLGWDAARLQAERAMGVAMVQRETALAWIGRYYPRAMRDLLRQQLQETRVQLAAAETAYGSGRASQGDVLAARVAIGMLEDRLSQIDQQERSATLQLSRWIGSDAERVPTGAPPWQTSEMQDDITTEHLKTHPDIAAQQAQVSAAQLEAKLAQANQHPDWTLEANYSQRGPAWGNMVSFGLSIPLQLDRANRQDRELAARLAQQAEAQARLEDTLRGHEAQLRGLLNDWQSGKERLARYSATLVPLAHQRTESALTAYRTAKLDLAGVLAARRDELEVRMQALSLEMDTARAWASLNYITPAALADSPTKDKP
jgi:outer membrane protein TolC